MFQNYSVVLLIPFYPYFMIFSENSSGRNCFLSKAWLFFKRAMALKNEGANGTNENFTKGG